MTKHQREKLRKGTMIGIFKIQEYIGYRYPDGHEIARKHHCYHCRCTNCGADSIRTQDYLLSISTRKNQKTGYAHCRECRPDGKATKKAANKISGDLMRMWK